MPRRPRVAAAAVLFSAPLLALAVAGCGPVEEVGAEKEGKEVSSGEKQEAYLKEKPAPVDPLNDGQKDMTVKSCAVGDPYGLGESVVVADLSFKNSSSKVSDYVAEIEVTDSNGDRVDLLYGGATNVSPGQTVDTGEEDGTGLEQNVTGEVKCRVLTVDRQATIK